MSAEDRDELIPNHITTRSQLNEWEQRNILEAELWAFARRSHHVLSVEFLKALHRRMFDRTWKWAGRFRNFDTNIGVPKLEVSVALRNACDDAELWIRETVFSVPESAVRFHHRVVSVHPFPNGNGRHARLAADVLLHTRGHRRLDWGGTAIDTEGQVRTVYIDALRAADEGVYQPLIAFVGLG